MSTINIEVTKNVYDVDLQQNVTSYDVTLEKGYYPLPGGGGGSGLALGETESTAYRGDRGKTAYEHSIKTTGNPHNTKVEELTDIGNETTTIEDTDVILKKEVVS